MSLTIDQGKELIKEFCAAYPAAYQIRFTVRNTQEDIYGQEATKEKYGTIYGGFHPSRGHATFAASNFRDADQFEDTIRHEILGHFGINTFTAGEKRSLLTAITEARDQPGVRELWDIVDRHYPTTGESLKAEEVYAFACEIIDPRKIVDKRDGEQAFKEVCADRLRSLTLQDLIHITSMVAGGLHDHTRSQQIFPSSDQEQFRRDTKMENAKKPFHETVAEKLIEQLKEGTAPWQKPWEAGDAGSFLPLNPTTGKRYKGINAIQLMSQGYDDQRWLTYKQAAAVDAQVRKGEKGTQIQYWKFSEEQSQIDEKGKPVLDARGEVVKQTVKLERPRVFFATVFNAEQIDGMPPLEPRKEQTWNAVDRAEQILQASGAQIRNSEQNRAFYRPATDSIHLPDKSQFPTADNYYATALHELGHWTGHETRLDRDLVHPFGSEGYAKEELRAEIASMILGDELGIGHDPKQHAAYVGSWIKALQDDPMEIFRAAADAEKIQGYVLGLEQKRVQEQTTEQEATMRFTGSLADQQTIRDGLNEQLRPHGVLVDFEQSERVGGLNLYRQDGSPVMVNTSLGNTVKSFSFETPATAIAAWWDQSPEVAMSKALAADIGVVLNAPDTSFSHYEAFQGETLDDALRSRGLTTIGSVTGSDPVRFYEKAQERLSPVFSLEPDQSEVGNAYLGKIFLPNVYKELVREFASKAEQLAMPLQQRAQESDMKVPQQNAVQESDRAEKWMLGHIERGTLSRVLDKANLAQLNRIQDLLATMEPLNTQNEFWQRHELPQDVETLDAKIEAANDLVELRQVDARVAAARLELVTGRAHSHERAGVGEAFDLEADEAFGFTLPHDWTGRVQVQGTVAEEIDGRRVVTSAVNRGLEPESWSVYAEHDDGMQQWLADMPTRELADRLAERLALVDAHSSISEHEKAAKLARVIEERVRRDPNSTDEDISAAKEARKDAEFVATKNDADLQRRIEEQQRDRAAAPAAATQLKPDAEKILITVPYKQKEEVKALGAKWDRQEQSWYVPPGVDPAPFARWAQGAVVAPEVAADKGEVQKPAQDRTYLAVPYGERVAAKAAGAEWDKAAKSWYAGPNADMAKLEQWKPENVLAQQGPAITPREEFADALKSVGCVVSGDHPIMDGLKHRITVEGEKFTENSGSGFYVGHQDGHPAGYIKNNKTGVDLTWKSKGYTLDPEQKALMAAEAATKLQQREAKLSMRQDQAAKRVVKQMDKLMPVEQPTPYMLAKGIEPQAGAFTDKDGKKTYLPASDVDGKQWTMQYIQEDGTKRFAKDSRKEGCFHVVGGMAELVNAPAIVISEGYATAASLKQSLGYATVSAFDSGNLAQVAQALHQKFPDKPVIIAGDDDRHLEAVQGVNPGRSKAEEAAKLVGGKMLLPIFAPGENSYPADLDPVTPEKYRKHQKTDNTLSDEQLAALSRMKQYTDFNDLATKSALGQEGLDRQVRSLVDSVIEKHSQVQVEQQQQEQGQGEAQEAVQAEKPKRRRAVKVA